MKNEIYEITDNQDINNTFKLVGEFQLHEFLITQIWYEIERLQNWQNNMNEDKMNEIFKLKEDINNIRLKKWNYRDVKNKLKTYDYIIKRV